MKIVTTGAKYIDIDSYAGCIAYAELLNLQGDLATAFCIGTLNKSIPQSLRAWEVAYETEYAVKPNDEYVLIDISDVDGFKDNVDPDRVVEVIDHHLGFEEYWHQKIGDNAHIEFIGAACTLVYERWVRAGLLPKMNKATAGLLTAGILDNTLNFKASVTTERDIIAYKELLTIAELSNDWPEQYFSECQAEILQDVGKALRNDSKILQFAHLSGTKVNVGQFAIWDAQLLGAQQWDEIELEMAQAGMPWFVNIISIGEGASYFVTPEKSIQAWAQSVLGVDFVDIRARAKRLWLRKEIIKADIYYKKIDNYTKK